MDGWWPYDDVDPIPIVFHNLWALQIFFFACTFHPIPFPPSVSLSLPLSYAKCGGSTKLWCLHEKLTSVCDKTFHDLYMGWWWLVLAAATEVTLALELACASSFVPRCVCPCVSKRTTIVSEFILNYYRKMYVYSANVD